jgi:RHS repeat-associated protein
LTKTVNGVTTTYAYDGNDRLLNEKVDGATTATYNYDNNGSTLTKTENGVTTTYTWNDEKRLVSATVGTQTVDYAYNDQGIRVSSKQNGIETRYLLDEGIVANVWEEYAPNGTVQASYVYGNDLITQTQAGQTSYYLVDGLGSTRLLTDIQGQVLNSYSYEAFGQTVSQTGNADNKYQYAGEQFDAALGDYYLRQRFYDTSSGRFGRMDTYEGRQGEPLTLHKYSYANGSPINYTDPTGYTVQEGNWIHNILGANFVTQAGISLQYPVNPRNRDGLFIDSRVFDPRFPLDVINIFAAGSRNRPTFGRVVRTALNSPRHRGVPGLNGKVPDLVDFNNEEFYEIKSNKAREIRDGLNELRDLEGGFNSINGLSGWDRGTNYSPLSPFPLPNGNIVLTRYHSNGLIVYDIFNTRIALVATYLTARAIQEGLSALIASVTAALGRRSAALGI